MFEIQDYILFVLIIIAFFWDVKYHKLPNWLTAGAMVIGIVFHLITDGINGLIFSFLGLLVAGGIFLILYIFKALGAGDVKLFAAIGAIVGVEFVLYMMMYSIVVAGLIAIVILLFTRTFLHKMTSALFHFIGSIISKDLGQMEEFKATKGTKFPFMYAVLPAIILAYYYHYFSFA